MENSKNQPVECKTKKNYVVTVTNSKESNSNIVDDDYNKNYSVELFLYNLLNENKM